MITLAIPTYNRTDLLFESFSKVVNNEFITEICIVDDCSDVQIYDQVCNTIKNTKIKIYRNETNLGSFLNKVECVKKSTNDWVILLDSDNIIDVDYINIVKDLKDPERIYAPSHAVCHSPSLNYFNYAEIVLDRLTYKKAIHSDDMWSCILNTGNYYFNRANYLKCVEKEPWIEESFASDAYYLVYLWFKNIENATLEVVEDLKYFHRLHSDSHYIKTHQGYDVLGSIRDKVKLWS